VADDEVGCIVITAPAEGVLRGWRHPRAARGRTKSRTQAELDALGAERARGFYEIGACAKPTIGMINGLAYGGAGVLASSLDMRVGCEHASFRFLAAAYGRINTTWTLPTRSAGHREGAAVLRPGGKAEEAQRIGLLNHLVPCAELRDKTRGWRR